MSCKNWVGERGLVSESAYWSWPGTCRTTSSLLKTFSNTKKQVKLHMLGPGMVNMIMSRRTALWCDTEPVESGIEQHVRWAESESVLSSVLKKIPKIPL